MKIFSFHIEAKGRPSLARLQFVNQIELRSYHRSLPAIAPQTSPTVRDAVEFTRLAAKRWRYYSAAGEAVNSFSELKQAIRRDSRCEVAFILTATTTLAGREFPVGLAYCRRTWCHHLALDFLALHPRTFAGSPPVAGVGSGMAHGLVQLAKALQIRRIWGEATANSAPFYERLLELTPILDFFVIEAREMKAIQNRQAKILRRSLATAGDPALK